MRCYCCDILLSNATLDKPTGRYYCAPCMEATNEVILKLIEKEYSSEERDFFSTINTYFDSKEISIEELEEKELLEEEYQLE